MKLVIVFISLLMVFACAGFGYKYYGIDTNGLPADTLKKIDLVAGRKNDPDKTLSMCATNRDSDSPNCVVMSSVEFRDVLLEFQEMKTRLKNCERQ
jgi:hypothetical protein